MIVVDAIRCYISRSGYILEGFLGQQNPQMNIRQIENGIRLEIVNNLTTVKMRRVGSFGVDIYFPLSELNKITEEISSIIPLPAGKYVKPNWAKTHRPVVGSQGVVHVPHIPESFGSSRYTRSQVCLMNNSYTSDGGNIYIDIESHDPLADRGHDVWANNPVMEAFELHFGIRGSTKGVDPFNNSGRCQDNLFALDIVGYDAVKLLSILQFIKAETNYSINKVGQEYKFEFTDSEGQVHLINKAFRGL